MNTINLQEILIVNGIGITIMAYLLLMRFQSMKKKDRRERLFDAMVWMTIGGCTVETLSFLVDGKLFPGSIALSYLFNSLCFIFTCGVGFFWCLYVELRIYNRLNRKRIYLLFLPFFVDIMLCMMDLLGCNLLFAISEENIYSRGRFSFLNYGILFFYFLYSIFIVDHSKKRSLHVQDFPTAYFVIPCILGTLIQGMMYGISVGWAAVAMAFLFVYIQLQSLNALTDPLSGLYNRRYLDNILEHLQRNPSRSIYGIMMDVNNFKKINDCFGHSEGDNVIRNIGKILSDSIPDCGIAIRYAGDEFIVLLSTESEEVVVDTIQKVQQNVERFNTLKKSGYQLSLSMGYERFDEETGDTEAFLLAIDTRMYEEKEKYYREREQNRC